MMAAVCFGMTLLLYFTAYQKGTKKVLKDFKANSEKFTLLIHCHSTESRAQTDSVLQRGGDVTATEGEAVTLSCEYNTTSTNAYLFWYKQQANGSPTFILSRSSFNSEDGETADEFKDRFNSSLDAIKKSVPLNIQRAQLSDSGTTYYCALRPTVLRNHTHTVQKH